jgi:D-xylonolactonase
MVADTHCVTGEGPLWNEDDQCLYWVDIPQGQLFRYDPAAGSHELVYQGDVIGGYTLEADGAFLFFQSRGAVRRWKDGQLTTIIEEIPEERDSRFNDVIADPEGRVFCGTMPANGREGRLYRLDPGGQLTCVREDAGLSNGMGFTPDLTRMYHCDTSDRRVITIFDYDRATGDLTNRRIFVKVPEDEGLPDGMTVDAEGYIWSAHWDGSALYRYTPTGEIDQRIPLPAKKVSSAAFGGRDFTDLYVTTAGGNNRATEGSGAGALFRLRPGVKGKAEFRSRIAVNR